MSSLPRLVLGMVLVGGLTACEGPGLPSVVEGEPTCKYLKQAGDPVKGSLRQPVRLRVMDGEEVIATQMLYGIPESSPQKTRFLLPDREQKYTLEWAQCKGERAPTPFDPRDKAAQQKSGATSGYDCTEVDVYATVEHSTQKGDVKSHELAWVAPPNPACW